MNEHISNDHNETATKDTGKECCASTCCPVNGGSCAVGKMVCNALSCPLAMLAGIIGISATALLTAFASQIFLGLEPCNLCIIQRYPFALAIALGFIGVFIRENTKTVGMLLLVCALLFAVNTGVAFYHVGVEQHWWVSALEGCKVVFENEDSSQSVLDKIMAAPAARCDEIPWADPVFGISMAGYNVLLCAGLAGICLIGGLKIRRRPTA